MSDRQTYFTLRGKSKKDYEFSCYYPEDILPIKDCVYIPFQKLMCMMVRHIIFYM